MKILFIIGHALGVVILTLWIRLLIHLYGIAPDHLKWLVCVGGGYLTYTILVELAQFEAYVMNLVVNKGMSVLEALRYSRRPILDGGYDWSKTYLDIFIANGLFGSTMAAWLVHYFMP